MADITKDSFLESNRHTKVVFQRGRDVPDCDLNELQDILRSFMYRQFWSGIQGVTLNPAAVDASWKIVQNTGDTANKVNVTGQGVGGASGYLFCDGIALYMGVGGEEITGEAPDHVFVNNDTDDPRDDGLYLRVTEEEVSDPHPFNIIGETARRRKLQYSWYVDTGDADPPTSSDPYTDPIWSGGVRYFKMATITRPAHTSEILNEHIIDERFLLLQEAFSQIVREANHEVQALVAHTLETDQPYQFFDVDLPNARMEDKGCGFVWSAGRDDVDEEGYSLAELSHFQSPLLQGLLTLHSDYAFGCKNGTQFWDNLLAEDTTPVRLTESNEEANQLKPLGKYVEAHRGSILRSLNARVGISVGDGVNTFGDFNGTDALYEAFQYFMDHIYPSSIACTIYVKGANTVTEAHKLYTTSEVYLELIGEDRNSSIQLQNTTGTAISIPNGYQTFKNMFIGSDTYLTNAVAHRVNIQNCIVMNTGIKANSLSGNVLLVRDSHIDCTLPLQLEISASSVEKATVLVDNSVLVGTDEILKIVTTDGASGSGDLYVNNITITNSDLSSAKCITVDNHTSNAGNLYVNDVKIDNCHITGSSLLAMCATNSKRFTVNRALIQGTMYEATVDADTTFFIGCLNAGGTDLLSLGNEIILRDVNLNYSNAVSLGTVIKDQMAPSWVADGDWGALTLSAKRVVLHNVSMEEVSSGSVLSDVFVYNCESLDAKGVNINVFEIGATLPNQRVWVFPKNTGPGNYWNKRVVDSLSITFAENDGSVSLAVISALKATPAGNLLLKNSTIQNAGIAAITIAEGGSVPSDSNINGLVATDNTIFNNKNSIYWFYCDLSTRLSLELTISNNKIYDSSAIPALWGVEIIAKRLYATINNNTINSVGPTGIRITASDPTYASYITEIGNALYSNSVTKISIVNTEPTNPKPITVVSGNTSSYIYLYNITLNSSGLDPYLKGFETGYAVSGGYAYPIYVDNYSMVQNNSVLKPFV